MASKYYTPLRYPGGKAKIADFIKLIFIKNNLSDGRYVEPYAGGAGVALELLMQGYANKIHINDFDPGVHAFWYSVLNNTDEFCRKISSVKMSVEAWKRQRTIQRNECDPESLTLGFSTFLLNRTNRSGIIKGGIIGGLDQTGNFKMDARFNRKELIKRIQRIAEFGDDIILSNEDAIPFLKRIEKVLPQKSLVYLDPPYYVKGGELYKNFYKHQDHVDVEVVVKKMRKNWIVSYDNVPQISEMYSWSNSIVYDLAYSAAGAAVGSEIMFFSKNLNIPIVENPSRVKLAS